MSYCPECALWYLCGIPSEAEIYAIYQGYWFHHHPKQLDEEYGQAIGKAAKSVLAFDLRVQRLAALLGTLKGRSILEIGAGTGEFLLALRHAGANVIANEISPEACTFLEEKLHIPVVRGEIADARWDYELPDVIVMNDLVEHAIEPLGLLSRAISLLKRGGRLAIWTPNGGAAGWEPTTAQHWVGFRVDLEHLQYFSPRAVQVLSDAWGLSIDHLETTGYPGLSGIDRFPARNWASGANVAAAAKSVVKRFAPWISQISQIAREFHRPRERGTYHLFAILTKP